MRKEPLVIAMPMLYYLNPDLVFTFVLLTAVCYAGPCRPWSDLLLGQDVGPALSQIPFRLLHNRCTYKSLPHVVAQSAMYIAAYQHTAMTLLHNDTLH
jgi:hypothetical protein